MDNYFKRTWAEVNLDKLEHNFKTIRKQIASETKLCCVIKADAYGHGALELAGLYERLGADFFAVSNLEEALELRMGGISLPILILGYTPASYAEELSKNNISQAVFSVDYAKELSKSASDIGVTVKVHLKVDSGMGRIGVRSLDEAENLIANLKKAGASVEGIFTHFATADEADDTKFNEQLEFFTNIVNNLSDKPALVHASNSATSIWHSETIFNIVRLGIVMYGLNPSGTDIELPYPIKPALSLESSLVHVKTIPAGATVGYGATYTAQKEEYIATVPIGYADGWTRDLQGFSVLVNGQFCEIVGRVSMDQITIRLPEKFPIGTKVTLIGQEGDKVISATDLAKKRGTINYEVLCLLSDRIPRFYSK